MSQPGRWTKAISFLLPYAVVLLYAVAWLWPIGFGGRMPVGGDVTQFSLGLMGYLSESIRQFRIPFWNDIWGYGFPGLAESQMGVFYPPHFLLYGVLGTESAYTWSLVIHTLWGALGSFWAARVFGLGRGGATIASICWTGCGFFVIHLPHQWGYTTGSWLPWVIGASRLVVTGARPIRASVLLAGALAMQVLPGHFQLGFISQVSCVVVMVSGLLGRFREGRPWACRGLLAGSAFVYAAASAAIQLGPTADLAAVASSMRDWEYLAGFAATPFHLVNYIAPWLFRVSPLWRLPVWDTFHTSPEESLGHVGLVGLLLAAAALVRVRSDHRVVVPAILLVVTLYLGFGPYAPGSRLLFGLPGFSFFRAPARWSVGSAFALSILAGIGYEHLESMKRPRRFILGFTFCCGMIVLAYLAIVEGAFLATERGAPPGLARLYSRGFAAMPWSGDPSFDARMSEARRPFNDFRATAALAREGIARPTPDQLTLSRGIHEVLWKETRPTWIILALVSVVGLSARRPRVLRLLLVFVASAELLWLVRTQRPVDLGPIARLSDQSPVLEGLRASRGFGRVVDRSRNLPMLVGAAPVSGYRTLDLPIAVDLTLAAGESLANPDGEPAAAARAAGVGFRVLDPFEMAMIERRREPLGAWSIPRVVVDRAMAVWLFGEAWVEANLPASERFAVTTPRGPATTAWVLPGDDRLGTSDRAPVAEILRLMQSAQPLTATRERPEIVRVAVPAGLTGWVVVTQLAHPGWSAVWESPRGDLSATIEPVLGGFTGVPKREPEASVLRLEYRERTFIPSAIVSAIAWSAWLGLLVATRDRRAVGSDTAAATGT
ncbi:MAG: hypothetical protein SFX72_17510 [Isosphaeraceae bacterium]|nr:hypothetical protein [Isosphaeraceae bacterium]